VIQIPELRSSSLEDREFAMNTDLVPPMGTTVWLVIQPAGNIPDSSGALAQAGTDAGELTQKLPTTAPDDDARMAFNTQKLWEKKVGIYEKPVTQAAQTHYEVITALENEKRRLTDESDRIGTLIDDLERRFTSMSAPRPAPAANDAAPAAAPPAPARRLRNPPPTPRPSPRPLAAAMRSATSPSTSRRSSLSSRNGTRWCRR